MKPPKFLEITRVNLQPEANEERVDFQIAQITRNPSELGLHLTSFTS